MNRTFRIEYELEEFGWAEVAFSGEGWQIGSSVSYISDPLYHLGVGVLAFYDDTLALELDNVVFDAEGGGLRMRVDTTDFWETDDVDGFVLKVRLEDLAPDLPNAPPGLPRVFDVTVGDFAREILHALESVYDRHGVVGYRERWLRGGFPLEAMIRLRHELGLPPVDRRLW